MQRDIPAKAPSDAGVAGEKKWATCRSLSVRGGAKKILAIANTAANRVELPASLEAGVTTYAQMLESVVRLPEGNGAPLFSVRDDGLCERCADRDGFRNGFALPQKWPGSTSSTRRRETRPKDWSFRSYNCRACLRTLTCSKMATMHPKLMHGSIIRPRFLRRRALMPPIMCYLCPKPKRCSFWWRERCTAKHSPKRSTSSRRMFRALPRGQTQLPLHRQARRQEQGGSAVRYCEHRRGVDAGRRYLRNDYRGRFHGEAI